MDNKYLEDEYKELEHGDIENLPHPELENKNSFSNNLKDIYSLNSYGFDEGQQVLHTVRHQKIDLGFHIENHILDVIEKVRRNIKGKQDMSNTQDNLIVMDRLDVLEHNLKEHVTNAKNEIKTHTTKEVTDAKVEIKTHTTTEVDNATNEIKNHTTDIKNDIKSHATKEVSDAKTEIKNHVTDAKSEIKTHTTKEVGDAVTTINSHTTTQRTTLWNSISSSLNTMSSTLSNIWNRVSSL